LGLYRAQRTRNFRVTPILGEPSFETILRTHQGAVRAFLRRVCSDAALADDLAQDAFIKAYHALDQLSDPTKIRSWLFGIAYREFLDHARKKKRRRRLSLGAVAPEPAAVPSGQALDIERAMDSLPPDCRAVVILCLLHGLTQAEAATTTGLPLGTVKSHVTRGKAKLQAVLAAYAPARKSDRSFA